MIRDAISIIAMLMIYFGASLWVHGMVTRRLDKITRRIGLVVALVLLVTMLATGTVVFEGPNGILRTDWWHK